MDNNIRYVHTNLIAKDWKKLSEFYIKVLGCKPVLPERDLSGQWIDELTGIPNVRVRGMHLRLPGSDTGTTLEIFEYPTMEGAKDPNFINKKGFGHLAFHVDSVEAVYDEVLKHGGKALGKIVQKEYPGIGLLTAVYVADPEGNFIELQNWSR